MELGALLLSATLLPYLPQTATPPRPRFYAVAMIAGSHLPADTLHHYRDFMSPLSG